MLNERVSINVNEAFQQQLNDTLKSNLFTTRANQTIELAFALGTGAFVEYVDKNRKVNIDYINAEMIYPLSWENGEIIECAFGSIKVVSNIKCIYLMLHRVENGYYVIENLFFDYETGEKLTVSDIEETVRTGSQKPLFQIIKPNIINNVDLECPMGISVYANAIPIFQGLDLVYDSYINEFDLGRKRIMVPASMAKIKMGQEGVEKPIFDTRDVAFYAYQYSGEDMELKEINMTIRSQEHEQGLQTNLNLASKKAGLGNDRYQFNKGGIKTATEVISEKSELYQNLCKHEILIDSALKGMVEAIAFLSGYQGDLQTTVLFDDSVINDDNTRIDNNIKLVGAELKSKVRAIMDIHGLDEKQAKKEYQKIVVENRTIMGSDIDLFGNEGAQHESVRDT